MKKILFIFLLGMISIGCTTQETISEGITSEVLLDTLQNPWGMAFIDEKNLLLTQKNGEILHIKIDSRNITKINHNVPIVNVGQGGLLDIAYENPYVYISYSASKDNGITTHVGRGILENNELLNFEVLFYATPAVSGGAHFGSRILLLDEYLFASVGDRGSKDFSENHPSQDNTNTIGSIIRIYKNGSIPNDNPFDNEIYSYGHRNNQGLTLNQKTGEIWASEHGERDGDALHIIHKGANYGWPIGHFGCRYGTNRPVSEPPTNNPLITPPVYHWECTSGGFPPAGMTFYFHDKVSEWYGNLFVGNLAGRYQGRFLVEDGIVTEIEPIYSGNRVRDVAVSPDGYLYIITDEGKLIRFS